MPSSLNSMPFTLLPTSDETSKVSTRLKVLERSKPTEREYSLIPPSVFPKKSFVPSLLKECPVG
ncbi:hypothetical protein OAQ17_00945 [Candidatus Pelagibacter sp.]|nr:hypothetical protein [Candidatus Pelagibacter sp.]